MGCLWCKAAIRYVPQGRGRAQSAMGRLWLFLLMALATLGRGERVSRIQFSCITSFCDSITIQNPTSKSDILGLMSYAKMCYANCLDPRCCLATALGVEFLSRLPTGNFQFLFGESGETSGYIVRQMAAALRTIIDSVGAANLGTVIERLTMHFLKKTGLRILRDHAAGIVDNDSRELRADHKVGPYCQRSDLDGVTGRTLAFLKPGTSSFGLSPPHFHETIVRAIPWGRIVPGYGQYSIETRAAVHLSVASAIANADFLTKNLSRLHPFHTLHHLTQHHTLPNTAPHSTIHHHTPPHTTLHHHTLPHTTLHHPTPPYTTLHHPTPPFTTVHHHTPPHTTTHHHTPPYTTTHHHAPPNTAIHHPTPPYTTLHHHAPLYTTMHHYAPLCTTIHHLTPPCVQVAPFSRLSSHVHGEAVGRSSGAVFIGRYRSFHKLPCGNRMFSPQQHGPGSTQFEPEASWRRRRTRIGK